jgi:uncharacterized coiled-coil protein SlyX
LQLPVGCPEGSRQRIAELKTTVAQQQKQIEVLTATVRKVTEPVELSAHAKQIVVNDE